MKKINKYFRKNTTCQVWNILLFIAFGLISYNGISASGQELFEQNCKSCHAITSKKMVGPGLLGVNDKYEEDWLVSWIKDPMGMVNSGDENAVAIYEEFNKTPMPGFSQFSDSEIKDILSYLESVGSQGSGGGAETAAVSSTDENEEEGGLGVSNDIVFWSIIILAIVLYMIYYYKRKMKQTMNEYGYFGKPHDIPDYVSRLLGFLIAASVVIYLVIRGLQANNDVLNVLMFTVLPYLAFGIFLVGSIYRYLYKGYQVSSLSSQFLEGKKLFWGSQPFHWGLLILFFGHLIAFLFPSALMAWNGQPVRLLILEISSFAFGLAALFGLVLLLKRRMTTRKLLVVSNNMDLIVYTVLLIQIISGLGVAFFVRWGSSWFASVLTPYLRSVFSFSPDTVAVSDAPWLIQIHIISAFIIIGIIPFTRFMHFLVAPIDYIWRKYQVVIWNWNPKQIRKSIRHTFGKNPRNH